MAYPTKRSVLQSETYPLAGHEKTKKRLKDEVGKERRGHNISAHSGCPAWAESGTLDLKSKWRGGIRRAPRLQILRLPLGGYPAEVRNQTGLRSTNILVPHAPIRRGVDGGLAAITKATRNIVHRYAIVPSKKTQMDSLKASSYGVRKLWKATHRH